MADGLPNSSRFDRWDVRTVGDLLSAWKEEQRGRIEGAASDMDESTFGAYDYCIRRMANPSYGLADVAPRMVDQGVLERYRNRRLKSDAAASTVNQEFKVLRLAWAWGVECRYIVEPRVLPRVRARGAPKNCTYRPTEEQVESVIAIVSKKDPEVELAVWLLFCLGPRIGEVVEVRRCDIDPSESVITFGAASDDADKTGKRTVPLTGLPTLPADVVAVLVERAGPSDERLLSLAKNGRQQVQGFLNRKTAAAGVPRFTPKCLRDAFVDRALDAGMEPGNVAAITGHDPVTMYRFYRNRKPSPDRLRHAMGTASPNIYRTTGTVVQGPWAEAEEG